MIGRGLEKNSDQKGWTNKLENRHGLEIVKLKSRKRVEKTVEKKQ